MRGEVAFPRSAAAGWLVGPGIAMIAVTYGLARFAYGLFVPHLRETFDLSPAVLGAIGAGSYAGYCVAIFVSMTLTHHFGPRVMAVAAGSMAVVGTAAIAGAPTVWLLASGVLVAGSGAGLASPPMGEAVAMSVPEKLQDRSNTFINSGTSIGVAISGPAALLAAEQWRLAWAAFAALSLAALLWNALAMPRKPGEDLSEPYPGANTPVLSLDYLLGWRSAALFAGAWGVGFASAAYWNFSRDVVVQAGDIGEAGSTLFWTVIGVSALAGAAAGDLARRFGTGRAFSGSLLVMAGAIALLVAAPGVMPLSYLSAALFGSFYIMLTGVVLVWAVAVFAERPSAGIGAAFLMIAAGQVAGSPAAGALAGATSLKTAFMVFAGLAALTAAIKARPRVSVASSNGGESRC